MSEQLWNETSDNSPEGTIAVPKSFVDRAIYSLTVPLARALAEVTWITPNQISWLSGIIGGPISGWLIFQNHFGLAVLTIAISGILDCLDGDLARERGMASSEGDILDSVLDRYVDFFLISALILLSPKDYLILGLLSLLGTTLVPYIRARSEAEGKSTVATIGDRATRTILILLGLLTHQVLALLVVLAIISNIAAFHRLIFALRTPKSKEETEKAE